MLGWWAYASPAESFQKAKVAAERALAIDETLAEAHISLGMVRFLFDWDWAGAEREYQRAIELSARERRCAPVLRNLVQGDGDE